MNRSTGESRIESSVQSSKPKSKSTMISSQVVLMNQKKGVECLAMLSETSCVSMSCDKWIKVWDINEGKITGQYQNESITCKSLFPVSPTQFITAGGDHGTHLRLINSSRMLIETSIVLEEKIVCLAKATPKSTHQFWCGDARGRLTLLSLESDKQTHHFTILRKIKNNDNSMAASVQSVSAIYASPEAKSRIFVGGDKGSICIYSIDKAKILKQIRQAHSRRVTFIQPTSAATFISAGMDQFVRIFNSDDSTLLRQVSFDSPILAGINSLAHTSSGIIMLAVGRNIIQLDTATLQTQKRLLSHNIRINAVCSYAAASQQERNSMKILWGDMNGTMSYFTSELEDIPLQLTSQNCLSDPDDQEGEVEEDFTVTTVKNTINSEGQQTLSEVSEDKQQEQQQLVMEIFPQQKLQSMRASLKMSNLKDSNDSGASQLFQHHDPVGVPPSVASNQSEISENNQPPIFNQLIMQETTHAAATTPVPPLRQLADTTNFLHEFIKAKANQKGIENNFMEPLTPNSTTNQQLLMKSYEGIFFNRPTMITSSMGNEKKDHQDVQQQQQQQQQQKQQRTRIVKSNQSSKSIGNIETLAELEMRLKSQERNLREEIKAQKLEFKNSMKKNRGRSMDGLPTYSQQQEQFSNQKTPPQLQQLQQPVAAAAAVSTQFEEILEQIDMMHVIPEYSNRKIMRTPPLLEQPEFSIRKRNSTPNEKKIMIPKPQSNAQHPLDVSFNQFERRLVQLDDMQQENMKRLAEIKENSIRNSLSSNFIINKVATTASATATATVSVTAVSSVNDGNSHEPVIQDSSDLSNILLRISKNQENNSKRSNLTSQSQGFDAVPLITENSGLYPQQELLLQFEKQESPCFFAGQSVEQTFPLLPLNDQANFKNSISTIQSHNSSCNNTTFSNGMSRNNNINNNPNKFKEYEQENLASNQLKLQYNELRQLNFLEERSQNDSNIMKCYSGGGNQSELLYSFSQYKSGKTIVNDGFGQSKNQNSYGDSMENSLSCFKKIGYSLSKSSRYNRD